MKIADIEDGPVYWYDTSKNWGTYLTATYNQGPVVRVDDKRYTRTAWDSESYGREDPKGRYVAVRKVNEDGTPREGSAAKEIRYLQSTFIRDTMVNVREWYDQQQAADRRHEETRQAAADAAAKRRDALRSRLAVLGLGNAFNVDSTTGQHHNGFAPRVTVSLADPEEANLEVLLDRLEQATKTLGPGQGPAYDPAHADRLEHGAYGS
jgi:hypothetical protein